MRDFLGKRSHQATDRAVFRLPSHLHGRANLCHSLTITNTETLLAFLKILKKEDE
uniref:Uncharacterized protein n=1 Tax=uncultured nuHF1 cluster bacterium HF0130_31E21 TaxID=710728 RepID=E0XTP3_9BACT|nr:hypothetical protein [uncultured nuHF1 cluster bacterium HF0130_31E21]